MVPGLSVPLIAGLEMIHDSIDMEQTVSELQDALMKGPMTFESTVFAKCNKASVQTVAHYILASMDVLGVIEPVELKPFFTNLRNATDVRDRASLDIALLLALRMSVASVMAQASEYANGIAASMGLDQQVETTISPDAFDDNPLESVPNKVPRRPVLH